MADKISSIVVLTGAGISAESGLATFRASDGLWCNHRIEDVATPEAFERNPKLVHEFYNLRRNQLKDVRPNAAHLALAKLAREWKGDFLLVTQNVDDLHERAWEGEKPAKGFEFLHMHGELKQMRCTESGRVFPTDVDLSTESRCACCYDIGNLRPHIVWFGEMPIGMERIYAALAKCDLFISIGTSGNVYPAAGFVQEVKRRGHGKTVELNLEPSTGYSLFDEKVYAAATQCVPEYVERLLASQQ